MNPLTRNWITILSQLESAQPKLTVDRVFDLCQLLTPTQRGELAVRLASQHMSISVRPRGLPEPRWSHISSSSERADLTDDECNTARSPNKRNPMATKHSDMLVAVTTFREGTRVRVNFPGHWLNERAGTVKAITPSKIVVQLDRDDGPRIFAAEDLTPE